MLIETSYAIAERVTISNRASSVTVLPPPHPRPIRSCSLDRRQEPEQGRPFRRHVLHCGLVGAGDQQKTTAIVNAHSPDPLGPLAESSVLSFTSEAPLSVGPRDIVNTRP
jgi:hypothetical protein